MSGLNKTDRELLQQALDGLKEADTRDGYRSYSVYIEAIEARLAQPESLLNSVHCQCGASWTFKDGALNYKPPTKEWVGLTDEEIKNTRHHMVDGAYDYSFKQGARWAEAVLKEKNSD